MGDKKYLSNEQFEQIMAVMTSQEMTNGAAIGYMIMAAEAKALDKKLIRDLERMMLERMDFYSEGEAEEVYRRFT